MVMPGARVSCANHCAGWRAVNASRPPRRWPRARRRASRRVGRARLLDDRVGAHQEWLRNCESQCFGGLEVDDQIELGGLLNREVSRFGALEDPVHKVCGAPTNVGQARAIGYDAAGLPLVSLPISA